MMEETNNNSVKFNPDKKLNPQEFPDPFIFIVKKEIGKSFGEIVYGHDMKKFKTMEEEETVLHKKIEEIRKTIDESKFELAVIFIKTKQSFLPYDLLNRQIDEWSKIFDIPEKG